METLTFQDHNLMEKRVNPYNKKINFPNDLTMDTKRDDMTGWVRDNLVGSQAFLPDRDIYPDPTTYFNDCQRTSTVNLSLFDLTTQEGFKQHIYYEENGWIFKLPFKGITYTIPENTVWEHEAGMRVPKSITANITYQVLHNESPNMLTKFYGKAQTANIHYVESNDWEAMSGDK